MQVFRKRPGGRNRSTQASLCFPSMLSTGDDDVLDVLLMLFHAAQVST